MPSTPPSSSPGHTSCPRMCPQGPMTGRSRSEPEGGGRPVCCCVPVVLSGRPCAHARLCFPRPVARPAVHVSPRSTRTAHEGTGDPHSSLGVPALGGCIPTELITRPLCTFTCPGPGRNVHPEPSPAPAGDTGCAVLRAAGRWPKPQGSGSGLRWALPGARGESGDIGGVAWAQKSSRGAGCWLDPRGARRWGAGGASAPGPRPHRPPRLALQ